MSTITIDGFNLTARKSSAWPAHRTCKSPWPIPRALP
jgi:hypothetical protein